MIKKTWGWHWCSLLQQQSTSHALIFLTRGSSWAAFILHALTAMPSCPFCPLNASVPWELGLAWSMANVAPEHVATACLLLVLCIPKTPTWPNVGLGLQRCWTISTPSICPLLSPLWGPQRIKEDKLGRNGVFWGPTGPNAGRVGTTRGCQPKRICLHLALPETCICLRIWIRTWYMSKQVQSEGPPEPRDLRSQRGQPSPCRMQQPQSSWSWSMPLVRKTFAEHRGLIANLRLWFTHESPLGTDAALNQHFNQQGPVAADAEKLWISILLCAPTIAQSQSLAISALTEPNRQKSRRTKKGFWLQKSQHEIANR